MRNLLYISTILLFGCKDYREQNKLDSENSVIIEKPNTIRQLESTTKNEVIAAKKFKLKNSIPPIEDTLILETNNKDFLITPRGLFKTVENDTLQLKTELIIEEAYLYENKASYFVFFTDTDYEGATSWIQKFSKKPLNSSYVKQIPGFNLGQPIIDEQFAYVTTIGFVGKIDLETGEYVWKHEDLYDREKHSFNSFDTVILNQNDTEFISRNYQTNKIDKVIVNNQTGEIKRIEN